MTKISSRSAEILSRKGSARPMPTPGAESRSLTAPKVVWHPASRRRLELTPATVRAERAPGRGAVRASRSPEPRVRVSLRLDEARHRRLQHAARLGQQTQQRLLVQALDELFARLDYQEPEGDRRHPMRGDPNA